MRVVLDQPDGLGNCIEQEQIADYVYMYPPRQAYRPLDPAEALRSSFRSLDKSNDLNLYFHFPFCKQICAFCNLFSTVERDEDKFEVYLDYVLKELDTFAKHVAGKKIETLYLGGGTPSLLSPHLFERLFIFLRERTGVDVSQVSEVALEVAPDTVEEEKFKRYREIGINRVNLGVQSLSPGELHVIGRRYGCSTPLHALDIVQRIGFDNICVDLIYGLFGQTMESWQSSVMEVLEREPETICAYALTLRPVTGFSARGYRHVDGASQLAKYDFARETLVTAGYRQETHVRYIKQGKGGYLQKANHWRLQNVLGIGAGARSYLWEGDFRSGYSVRRRKEALHHYMARVAQTGYGFADGFLMTDDERRRKAVILGLLHLDRQWYVDMFGDDPLDDFPEQFAELSRLDLVTCDKRLVMLTAKGVRHRDLIVQSFFSEKVRELLATFDYVE
jgi:oxygen-independent coproporphyrinogen III oxidase